MEGNGFPKCSLTKTSVNVSTIVSNDNLFSLSVLKIANILYNAQCTFLRYSIVPLLVWDRISKNTKDSRNIHTKEGSQGKSGPINGMLLFNSTL